MIAFRYPHVIAAVVLAAVTATCTTARADEASATLARYDRKIDASIDRALAYLAKVQTDGGYFPAPMRQNTGVSSLSVMAFLAKGYTPGSGRYGGVINRGIDFILKSQLPNGMIVGRTSSHGPMYSHCISTLLLSEVSGMVDSDRQKKLDVVLGKALKVILAAQAIRKPKPLHQGGWRYSHKSKDSDISCTGWAVLSLRSARNSGAAVPKEAIDQALRFVMNCRTKDGGFAYQPGGGPGLARTGTALLSLELCGRHGGKAAIGAGEWILKHRKQIRFGGSHFYYGLYYVSQGMFQLGGKYWETFAADMYEVMLKYQKPDGSWPAEGGSAAKAGTCYSTAMGVLAMSVTYRQLPIYQR